MPRTKNVSRSERPLSPSSVNTSPPNSLDEFFASDHSHSSHSAASPSSPAVFSANSPPHHPSQSSPSPDSPTSSSIPGDPEYAALAAKAEAQSILKEKPFPLTPHTSPFVRQLTQLQLTNLAQPRSPGNLTFVRQFYTHARFSGTYGIYFRGVTIPFAFTSRIIREHFHLPVIPRCHYSELLHEYPWDDVLRTLCPEGAIWYQPRGAQRYIRRTDLLPEARPWLHFICNNILPTRHLVMIPKEQALYVYLLMVGRPVNLAIAITSALRQCILSTNVRHSMIFPHLITDIFRAHRVPELPTDLTFEPASPFIYVRLQAPRHLPPPPPAHPIPSPPSPPPPMVSSPLPPDPTPSVVPPSSDVPPSFPSPAPSPTVPTLPLQPASAQDVALLRADLRRLEAMMTMIAAHLGLPIPPPPPQSSAGPSASPAVPSDPPADDPPA